MSSPMVEVREVYKSFGNHNILEDLSLEVESGTTLALVGPSGSGKTTTLKLINRLVEPDRGQVFVDGQDISRIDAVALRRHIGYVVQEAGLFPHMTAIENVEVVPRLLSWSAKKRSARCAELFELMGLSYERYAKRYPAELSGGQRQRIGLARALAADPQIVLMDEPFGALDPIMRRHLQREFADIQSRLKKTTVVVTHDMEEACLLADRVAVLDRGRLQQIGAPSELRTRPASSVVSDMMGVSEDKLASAR